MDALSPDARLWLAFNRVPGLGLVRRRLLLEHLGDPRTILEAGPRLLRELGLSPRAAAGLTRPDWKRVDADQAWLAGPGRGLLTLADAAYPRRLREISDPPAVLFVEGDAAPLGADQIAIVGSRNPSATGRENAFSLARGLVEAGLGITSGLAIGIDSAGHRGALAAGGVTIAVAGNGLGRIYPRRNEPLARQIAERGCLVSEYTPDSPPRPRNFPRRNRIISGLSLGVVVVEAARRSGSLITARLAGEQGREVFAVPGSIHNPLSRGCHALLRDGAKLVETVGDVVDELLLPVANPGPRPVPPPAEGRPGREPPGPGTAPLLEYLGDEPTPVDLLVARSGLTAEAVSSMLLMLELQGHVSAAPGGFYFRVRRGEGR